MTAAPREGHQRPCREEIGERSLKRASIVFVLNKRDYICICSIDVMRLIYIYTYVYMSDRRLHRRQRQSDHLIVCQSLLLSDNPHMASFEMTKLS